MSEKSKNRIAFRLLFLVAFMLAMSFAAVPFYDWFCRVTGFGGVTQKAVEESDVILDREDTPRPVHLNIPVGGLVDHARARRRTQLTTLHPSPSRRSPMAC